MPRKKEQNKKGGGGGVSHAFHTHFTRVPSVVYPVCGAAVFVSELVKPKESRQAVGTLPMHAPLSLLVIGGWRFWNGDVTRLMGSRRGTSNELYTGRP